MADNFSQVVKQQADIVRIVGEYLKLRKSGANWSALCPFHKEKSGSFYLYPGTASYYCFGCHEHGDVFSFVMKMETLSFPEAVRAVATKMGIALPKREFNSPEEAREAGLRRQLMDVHEAATQYFEQSLKSPEAARAREYLTLRGVTAETIAKFRIGYAPESFNDMRDQLGKYFRRGVAGEWAVQLRRSRRMAVRGRCMRGFGSGLRFRLRMSRGSRLRLRRGRWIRRTGCEGRAEVFELAGDGALYEGAGAVQSGQGEGVDARAGFCAAGGRADGLHQRVYGRDCECDGDQRDGVYGDQVRLLGRFTKRVVLNFDPDQAGANAAEKTIALLVEEGFEVRVVTLEGGLDPDRYIKERGIAGVLDCGAGGGAVCGLLD